MNIFEKFPRCARRFVEEFLRKSMNIFENFPRCARRFVKNFSRKVDDMFNFCWGRCDRKWRFSNKETAFAKVQNFSNDLGRADISKLSAEAFIYLKSIIDWFQTDEWTSGCPECLFAAWDGRKNGAGGGVGREEEWDRRRRVTGGGVGRERSGFGRFQHSKLWGNFLMKTIS